MPTTIDLQPIKDSLERAPREQQAELATWLLQLLGPPGEPDDGLERAWEEEIARRVAGVESGRANLHSFDEVWDSSRRRRNSGEARQVS